MESQRSPFVELTDVTRTYKTKYDSVTALSNVNLSIEAGERLALLGRSGSGKSTLLNLLGGLDKPTSGVILVGRHELNCMDSDEMADYRLNSVGMIFQAFNLIVTKTAMQNVEMPFIFGGKTRSARRKQAQEALELVGLGKRTRHCPTQLSGGEQQRVAIARALANKPSLLLADEPTGNLDSATANEIMQQLIAFSETNNTTVVLVTHDEDLASKFAHRTLRLHDGKLVEDVMNWPDLLRSACFGLMQHKLRTMLTLCGVTLGSLLLFTSLSGGLGVIQTVNKRLGIGERLLEISVSSGFLVDPVSVEAARKAGFTQNMTDERRVRLAKASGVGGRKNVPLNLKSAKQLESMEHVAGAWTTISFRAAMYLEHKSHWTGSSVKAIQPNKDLGSFIVEGRPFSSEDANEIILGELFLYKIGIQSDEELAAVIGTKVRFVPNNNSIAQKAKLLLAIEKKKMENNQAKDNLANQRNKLQEQLEKELEKVDYKTGEFEIVGVVRTPSIEEMRFHPGLNDLARNVLMPHGPSSEIWAEISKPRQQVTVTVRADKPENVMRLETAISDKGFRTMSMSKLALQIRSAVLLITAIITAIAAAALLISGIGITNTMVMNVLERRGRSRL